jgi:phosphohistidine phosphatase SixA
MRYCALLILAVFFIGCKKDKVNNIQPTKPYTPTVTSVDYIDSLLFVNTRNYQIKTSDSATFSSANTHIQLSAAGLIKKLTAAEVVPITITWKNAKYSPTTIYAVGTNDTIQEYPFTLYHGEIAPDAYNNYIQGWKTLHSFPVAGQTYAIVLRHADASTGQDFTVKYGYPGPANWWESTDSTLARQLNSQGFDRGTQLGQIFKDLNYPIKRVVTSQFYRARQTATLMNMGPTPSIDGRINHPSYNVYVPGIFQGMVAVMQAQPVDNQITLIVAHHPINEANPLTGFPSFPTVAPFNWTGAYIIKVGTDKSLTYEGSVSWGMFKYWRDLKLHNIVF